MDEDICILMVPAVTYKSLSDAAKDNNISVAELFQQALNLYLNSKKPNKEPSTNSVGSR